MSGAPISIDFCNFGPGFCKTDSFFWHVLKRRFTPRIEDRPKFLIYTNPLEHMHRLHDCVRIYFGVESFLPDWSECDYALTSHYLDDARHLRLPFYVLSGDPRIRVAGMEDAAAALAQKTKFCSFVVSGHHPKKNRIRAEFFHALSRRKRVDSGGKFLNNIGGPIPGGPPGKLAFMRQYKFNIAFENAAIPGYTTEKIAEAMQARCVPLYWGNPRVNEDFNAGSFLNLADFSGMEAMIDRVMEMDRDDAQVLALLQQPLFPNDRITEVYSLERLLDFFEKIFTTPIKPVSSRRRWLQLGRWIAVKQNRPHS